MLFDDIDVNGADVDPVELRRRVGMVFQRPNPFPMSIFDNVAYGPRIHGERNRGAVSEIVEKSLRGAALWDEVKADLKKIGVVVIGGATAAVVYRARSCDEAGCFADG